MIQKTPGGVYLRSSEHISAKLPQNGEEGDILFCGGGPKIVSPICRTTHLMTTVALPVTALVFGDSSLSTRYDWKMLL